MSRAGSQPDVPGTLSADDRAAYSVALASGNERANRPTWAIGVAVVLLFASLGALLMSLHARGAANEALANERARAARFVEVAATYKKLLSSSGSSGITPGAPVDQIRSVIQNAATRAGMTSVGTLIPRTETDNRTSASFRNKLTFDNVRDPSLEAMLNWLKHATEDIPGLEVYSVTIKPEANVWHMRVVFTRWERTGT